MRKFQINRARGKQLPNAKLDPDAVRAIRENRRGMTDQQQAEQYGVSPNTVFRVRHYEAWRHV
jgi:DNA-binding transcriptional regulator YiaG